MNVDFKYVAKHLATRSHEEMRKVLMKPEAPGPAVFYYMIRGARNVTVWEPGTVGGEYVKTFGHYHIGKLDETYRVLEGEGVLLMQKLEEDAEGKLLPARVAEFKVQRMKAGDSVFIPAGHGHLAVNVGTTFFVTSDDSPVDFGERDPVSLPGHANYSMVEQMHGFAYYVVEHEGAPALVRNPRYEAVGTVEAGGLPVMEA